MLLQSSRYARLLRKLLTFVGPDPAYELLEQLRAVLVLEADRLEWAIYKGELPIVGVAAVAASVGNFSHAGIAMPANSGRVLTVTTIILLNGTAAVTDMQIKLTSGIVQDTTSQTLSRDLRVATGGASQVLTRTQAASAGSVVIEVDVPATGSAFVTNERGLFVLGQTGAIPPVGNAISVVPSATNLASEASFIGYERALEPAEVNP